MSVRIAVGTKNPAKLKAVEAVVRPLGLTVESIDAPSHVSSQPRSDEETRTGAINRANYCLSVSQADFAIGLEGGVMMLEDNMYVTNWGAWVDRNGHILTGSGARIPIPQELNLGIQSGKELGEVIDVYAQGRDIRKHEGTIGILTDGLITRGMMFEHIVQLLVGQYQYYYGGL